MVIKSNNKVDLYDKTITNCVECTGQTICGKKYTPTNLTCIPTCTCTAHCYGEGFVDAWALNEKVVYCCDCVACGVLCKEFVNCDVFICDDLVKKYDMPWLIVCTCCWGTCTYCCYYDYPN